MATLLKTTSNAEGPAVRIKKSGDYAVCFGAADNLGGGAVAVKLYVDGEEIKGPAELAMSAVGDPVVVSLAQDMEVRAFLTGATAPAVNVTITPVS